LPEIGSEKRIPEASQQKHRSGSRSCDSEHIGIEKLEVHPKDFPKHRRGHRQNRNLLFLLILLIPLFLLTPKSPKRDFVNMYFLVFIILCYFENCTGAIQSQFPLLLL
jgi:hypothetical protein